VHADLIADTSERVVTKIACDGFEITAGLIGFGGELGGEDFGMDEFHAEVRCELLSAGAVLLGFYTRAQIVNDVAKDESVGCFGLWLSSC